MKQKFDFESHPPVCFRLATEEKERFKKAAEADGKSLGTWLKGLARKRVEELELVEKD